MKFCGSYNHYSTTQNGKNAGKRKAEPRFPARCLFSLIPSTRQRYAGCKNNVNLEQESIFNCIHNYITDDIKNAHI